jgi:hypothetical protein
MKHLFAGILAAASLGLTPLAFADIVLNFNSPSGDQTPTHNYTLGTATIVATGFDPTGTTGKNDLFGKTSGTTDENGLGLAGDPSGDHEIWFKYGNLDFIQLNVSDLLAKGYTNIKFEMGSTTQGETWQVSACSVSGTLCNTSALTGTGELGFNAAPSNLSSVNHYLDFASIKYIGGSSANNVLLEALSAKSPVPEPRFYGLLLAGLLGLAGIFVKNRRAARA